MQPYPRIIQHDAGYQIRRNIRIGVSTCFAVMAAVLALLWLRSYWWVDAVTVPIFSRTAIAFDSGRGYLTTRRFDYSRAPISQRAKFTRTSTAIDESFLRQGSPTGQRFVLPYRFVWRFGGLTQPLWAPLVVCLCVAVAPWLRQLAIPTRYSIRSLLIITTLVALALGLAVWAVR
jgi:hypothetical protein